MTVTSAKGQSLGTFRAPVLTAPGGANPLSCHRMTASLQADLARLSRLAFRRTERAREVVREFHRVKRQIRNHRDYADVERLCQWLFVPLTLGPVDVAGLMTHVLRKMVSGGKLDRKTKLLLALLGAPPDQAVQEMAAAHEHLVQQGNYESLIKSQPKFEEMEQQLHRDADFNRAWNEIKEHFPVDEYRNPKGVVRRRMVQERNFRSAWDFRWTAKKDRFQNVFDAFCHKWNLYGMEGDRPLLLKLTVNLTPFGTMILIPAYWSFDPKRDLNWKAITALHRARGVHRQGPKLSKNRMAMREEAVAAKRLWKEAKTIGLKGRPRYEWVLARLHLDCGNDESKLKRLLRMR